MTETTLERAANALRAYCASDEVDGPLLTQDEAVGMVSAVLMAVREPGAAVVRAGCVHIEDGEGLNDGDPRWTDAYSYFIPVVESSFAAMIDAILAEGGG